MCGRPQQESRPLATDGTDSCLWRQLREARLSAVCPEMQARLGPAHLQIEGNVGEVIDPIGQRSQLESQRRDYQRRRRILEIEGRKRVRGGLRLDDGLVLFLTHADHHAMPLTTATRPDPRKRQLTSARRRIPMTAVWNSERTGAAVTADAPLDPVEIGSGLVSSS